jgi:hypothetical protein
MVPEAEAPNGVVLLRFRKISELRTNFASFNHKVLVIQWKTSVSKLDCPPHYFVFEFVQTPFATPRKRLFAAICNYQLMLFGGPFSDLHALYIVKAAN